MIKYLNCTSSKKPITISAAIIRRPETFFEEEKPKKLQRFLVVEPEQFKDNLTEKTDSVEIDLDVETAPLLGTFKPRRSSLGQLKDLVQKYWKPNQLQEETRRPSMESHYTWWTKFYNSLKDPEYCNEDIHKLVIFHSELENQKEFQNFTDWAHPVELIQGSESQKNLLGNSFGILKCSMKISKCSGREYFESEKLEKEESNFQ